MVIILGNPFFCDIDFDGDYENDIPVYKNRNVYCLISPASVSCSNLVASVFKNSDKVILLGKTSGGAACTVTPVFTADGTIFKASSPYVFCSVRNGTWADIDQGVEPNYVISKPEKFYDREYLHSLIHRIFD